MSGQFLFSCQNFRRQSFLAHKSIEFLVNFLVTVAGQGREKSAQIRIFGRSVTLYFCSALCIAVFGDVGSDFHLVLAKLVHNEISNYFGQDV